MGRHTLSGSEEQVLIEAYRSPFTIASNYARKHKEDIAVLASRGLLTVFYPHPQVAHCEITDHRWRVTQEGLATILDTRENGDE